jgi:uncharacterized caspase-like protein
VRAANSLHRFLTALPELIVLQLALGLLVGLSAAPAALHAATPQRVALVVGNNNYPSAPLLNPVNDARAMAAALQVAGFTVILRLDATQPVLNAAVRDFGNRIKEGGAGSAGLFYFAGHGMQIKGRNFLIPVGANIEHEDEVAYQALDAQSVLDKMESAGNGINLMILDACRNNPFARSFRSSAVGLAQMEQPVGTLVAYATAPGSVASDGQGLANGLYTTHLLQAMKQPGVKVEEVLKQVRGAVRRDSAGRQVPMEWNSLEGDFYFFPAAAGQGPAMATLLPTPAPDPQQAIDDALWSAVKDSSSSAELFAYLNRFPAGRHAKEARARLADLVAPAERPGAAAALPDAGQLPLPPGAPPDQPRGGETSELARFTVIQELERWGELGTERRPSDARRNDQGFAEGDRYRYRSTDERLARALAYSFWRIDRITPDGKLVIGDGETRLDKLGQADRQPHPRPGQWLQWSQPLPTAELARQGVGAQRAVQTRLTVGEGQSDAYWLELRGTVKAADSETLETPAGRFDTVRVDVQLSGRGNLQRQPGITQTPSLVDLRLSYWYARGVPLPVAWRWEERRDGILEQRLRQDLQALDVLGAAAGSAAKR